MYKPTVLVTGSTGSVGFEVVKLLYEKTELFHIVLFVKKDKQAKKLNPYKDKIKVVYGDITNQDQVFNACEMVDFVIHLAAIIPPLADDEPALAERVNTIGTQNIVEALENKSPKSFLFYSSSVSVYGDRLDQPLINVGDTLQASLGDEYAKTKIAAEKIIQESNLDWCIMRLCAIMGNHKMSKLMFHMPLATKIEMATPRDTALAFVNGLQKTEQLKNTVFNLGGGSQMRLSYQELLDRSFDIFGLGKATFPENTFATNNFHCGYYEDGDDLENIVQFRNDDLDSYFKSVAEGVPAIQKFFTKLFSGIIKRQLAKQSEPLQAIKENDLVGIERYFGVT